MDVLAVAAHPDDVELGCGGTVALLARSYEVGILDLTEGEASTRGTVENRRVEVRRASEILGLAARETARLPDTRLDSASPEQIETVVDRLRSLRPRVLLAPHPTSLHPDHAEAARLVEKAFYLARLAGYPTRQGTHVPAGLLFYEARSRMEPDFIVDITPVFETKMKAVHAYASQFLPDPCGPEGNATAISDPAFLEGLTAMSRYWGFRIGVRYGEPFSAREPLRVRDPLSAFFGP